MSNPVFNYAKLPILSQLMTSSLLIGLLTTLSSSAIALPAKLPSVAQSQTTPATNSVQTRLQGRWQTQASGQKMTLIFAPDGKFFMVLPLESGAPVAVPFGYRINPTPKPMHLDVILTETKQTVLTIFEFTDKDQLRLQLVGTNPGQPRPTAFGQDAGLFEKVSDETTLPPDVMTPGSTGPKGEQIALILIDFGRKTDEARETEGKQYVRAMTRAQQAQYLEFEKFTANIEDLGIDIKPETENYRYQILPQANPTQSVMMTARAKRPELRSYAGAVFVAKSETNDLITVAAVCETDKPSFTPPAMPTTPKQGTSQIQCPAGSRLSVR